MIGTVQPTWLYLEDDDLVIDPARGVVASVEGDRHDGLLLASAHRLFDALDQLDEVAAQLVAVAKIIDQGALRALVDQLEVARGEAALTIRLASGAREH